MNLGLGLHRVNLHRKYDHPYLENPALPIDNNHDEQQIRPWATGRNHAHRSFMRTWPQRARASLVVQRLLIELPKASTVDDYEALLPWSIGTAET